jgi:hypothetical protein
LDATERHANALLDWLRQSAMRRGAISRRQHQLKADITSELEAQGIPSILAQRIAFQLVFKFDVAELAGRRLWRAIGRQLQEEITRLRTRVGLADGQIAAVLPKLSADQVEAFLDELRTTDRKIARTILNAALQAAEPISAGRRYLAEYCGVAAQLQALDPSVARTLANATFTAGAPRRKAMEHLKQFAALMTTAGDGGRDGSRDSSGVARLRAKAGFRAADPRKAADEFTGDYNAVVAALASSGVDVHLARTLARSSRFRGHIRRAQTGPAPGRGLDAELTSKRDA